MDLKEFLEKHSISRAQFARMAGISKHTIYVYLRGEQTPIGETAKKIVEATNGEVTYEDIWSKKTT